RSRPLLPGLRGAHGALRSGAPGQGPPCLLRKNGRGHARRDRAVAGVLQSALRRTVPALLRERAQRAHGELRAGARSDLQTRRRPLASLRTVARSAERSSRACAGELPVRKFIAKPLTRTIAGETFMTRSRKRKLKGTGLALTGMPLASTVLTGVPAAQAQEPGADQGGLDTVVISAQKRDESLQDVPISVTALGTEKLEELHVSNFEDYVKFLPSVSFQTTAPGFSLIYMRGVASGENGNHSTSLP